ncbi:OadG family protein [Caloranaerobacter azorensis]|uniref:OadG family protein n=1 Tax=Caloranaerobacter azorensis TaxID=116090 RepID=UPI00068FD1B7|nr:OadG family protein [Caloranaerobacter azorensis]
MLGDNITIGQVLIVTVFSMGIVFLALLVISYIIDGFRFVFYKENKGVDKRQKKSIKPEKIEPKEIFNEEEDDEELVAVITAAIAANISRPASEIKIRNIKRVPTNTPVWARAGRLKQFELIDR